MDPEAGSRLSVAVRAPQLCLREPVSSWPQPTAQNPAECSVFKVNSCSVARVDQLGWGRGRGQPDFRKEFSLTALKQKVISLIQALGEVERAGHSLELSHSRPHLALQPT